MSGDKNEVGTTFQRSLGLRWISGEGGKTLTVAMDILPEHCGPAGSLEGGIVSTLVDVAGASACAMALKSPLVATQHVSLSFLAPGRVGPVEATTEVVRIGRTDAVAEVRVVDRGSEDRLMAIGLVTVRNFGNKPKAS